MDSRRTARSAASNVSYVVDFPPLTDDDDDEKPVESNEEKETEEGVTRCVCGSTDAIGVMVQCDSCSVWQHCACVRLNPKRLPNNYFCEACRTMDYPVDGLSSDSTRRKRDAHSVSPQGGKRNAFKRKRSATTTGSKANLLSPTSSSTTSSSKNTKVATDDHRQAGPKKRSTMNSRVADQWQIELLLSTTNTDSNPDGSLLEEQLNSMYEEAVRQESQPPIATISPVKKQSSDYLQSEERSFAKLPSAVLLDPSAVCPEDYQSSTTTRGGEMSVGVSDDDWSVASDKRKNSKYRNSRCKKKFNSQEPDACENIDWNGRSQDLDAHLLSLPAKDRRERTESVASSTFLADRVPVVRRKHSTIDSESSLADIMNSIKQMQCFIHHVYNTMPNGNPSPASAIDNVRNLQPFQTICSELSVERDALSVVDMAKRLENAIHIFELGYLS